MDARHFDQVLYAYRHEHRPVLTQAKVGRWLGLTQGQVSRLERSEQATPNLRKLDHWARALHIPEQYLWFHLSQQPTRAYSHSRDIQGVEHETGGEDVQRRQLLHALAAGAATAGSSGFGWFGAQPQPQPTSSARAVGMPDVQIIREMTQTFRGLDNRFGGGRARSVV
ncbi:MAG: helix-turn-helix domain-containing protein, partial [Actinomycetota bacterium]|nr:helix-turn-helix domain-containing protein [Actinomycetota bacterium]